MERRYEATATERRYWAVTEPGPGGRPAPGDPANSLRLAGSAADRGSGITSGAERRPAA